MFEERVLTLTCSGLFFCFRFIWRYSLHSDLCCSDIIALQSLSGYTQVHLVYHLHKEVPPSQLSLPCNETASAEPADWLTDSPSVVTGLWLVAGALLPRPTRPRCLLSRCCIYVHMCARSRWLWLQGRLSQFCGLPCRLLPGILLTFSLRQCLDWSFWFSRSLTFPSKFSSSVSIVFHVFFSLGIFEIFIIMIRLQSL
jgi:hypothetical protein